jgi:hypothetical protein
MADITKFTPYAVVKVPFLTKADTYASNNAESVYPDKAQANKERDAYRHILWQAMLANRYGEPTANFFGNMHESKYLPVLGGVNQPADQREMDLYNNQLGVKLGLKAKDMKEMMEEAKRIVDSGMAKVNASEGTY